MNSGVPARVLFISHDDFRAGAPIVLLRLLRWLRVNSTIQFEVLLGDCYGQLRPDFELVGAVSTWSADTADTAGESLTGNRPRRWPTILPSIVRSYLTPVDESTDQRDAAHRAALIRRWQQSRVELIYSNTIMNGAVLDALSPLRIPVLTHVHELGSWIRQRLEPSALTQAITHSNRYIAAAEAVKTNLVDHIGIPSDLIDVVHEFIESRPAALFEHQQADLRRELQIPEDALVVGGSGTLDWRKAPDLFVQLAAAIGSTAVGSRVHFLWVGGNRNDAEGRQVLDDAERCHARERMHFTGVVEAPLRYFALFDVFAMTSREDPYPLVNLEVASLGKPIVCFAGAGGSPEFVSDDCGYVVPYLDVESMAARIVELLSQPELRSRLGERAREKVCQTHDVSVVAPRIVDIMSRLVSKANPA